MTRFFLTSTRKIIPALLSLAILFLCAVPALAQSTVTIIGPITPGDLAQFNSQTIIKDGGIPGGAALFANPTGAVGLTAVNGSALTAMRSDASPPLSASVQAALTGTAGELLIGTGGFGFAAIVLGGDCTFTSPNITCTKTNGTAFGTFATANAATPPAIGGTTPAAGSFSSLTDTGITGSTQCVQANSGGALSGTGVPCGSGSGGSGSLQPTGRLTLVSAKPVMGTSQAAATTVYYTPYLPGDSVPLFNGSTFTPTSFTEVSQATTDTTKSPAAVAASSCYDLFAWSDSGTFRVTRAGRYGPTPRLDQLARR